MLAFVLRRIGQAVLVMLAVGLIAFSLFTFVGDPVLFMLGQDATPEDRVRVAKLLGLDAATTREALALASRSGGANAAAAAVTAGGAGGGGREDGGGWGCC